VLVTTRREAPLIALVTTTIYVPRFLDAYLADARAAGHERLFVVVAGDRKTPPETTSYCADVARRTGYEVVYLDVPGQEDYLQRFPELAHVLPWDCIQRRNVGMVLAYERGADIIVTIDDDNLLAETDYLAGHAAVGTDLEMDGYAGADGWLNVCDFLEEAHGFRFFHRGFPPAARAAAAASADGASPIRVRGRLVVNAGLWLDEPDVDAVTRLALPLRVTGYRRAGNFALAPGTWSPFNSQNTALAREALPAYFLSASIGRYDDIWASYVLLALAARRGDLVAFGRPLARQQRNPHDAWHDLDRERDFMGLTDRFCRYLRDTDLAAPDYAAGYRHATEALKRAARDDATLDSEGKRFLETYVAGMYAWCATFDRIAAT
jgi:hypothetical protein